MEPFLIANVIITPDGTRLISHDRLDKVIHFDVVTQKTYYTNGGIVKFDHSDHGDEQIIIVTSDSPFGQIREFLSRGLVSNGPVKWVALKNMSNAWLDRSIKYIEDSFIETLNAQLRNNLIEPDDYNNSLAAGLSPQSKWFIEQYKKELVYRQLKRIFIQE